MAPTEDADDAALVFEIANEIHRFLQANPNHYAARAFAQIINRTVAGERVNDDERELVLLTLVREAKDQARGRRFGR